MKKFLRGLILGGSILGCSGVASAQAQFYYSDTHAAVGLGEYIGGVFRETRYLQGRVNGFDVSVSTIDPNVGLVITSAKSRGDGGCPESGSGILTLDPKTPHNSNDDSRNSIYNVQSVNSYLFSDGRCFERFYVSGQRWDEIKVGYYHLTINHPDGYHNHVEMLIAKLNPSSVEVGGEVVSVALYGPSMSVGHLTSDTYCLAKTKDGFQYQNVIAQDSGLSYISGSGRRCNGFFRYFDIVFSNGKLDSARFDFKMDLLTSNIPAEPFTHRTQYTWHF